MYKPSVPDLLSISRAVLSLPGLWAIANALWHVALPIFLLAVTTDLLDGFLARKLGHTSRIGAVLDHGSDAVFVFCCLLAMAIVDVIHWLLPLLVALAFTQYILDSRVIRGGALIANRLGKYNGITYYLLAGSWIIQEALGLSIISTETVYYLGWFLAASTIVSMINRWYMLSFRKSD